MHSLEVRRRRWPWVLAVAAAGIAGLVLVWFQPQKLFIDERVDDPVPVAADVSTPSAGGSTEPAEVPTAMFVSLDHGTSGQVRVIERADGTRVLRLEDLDTSNGPDLFLYLSTNEVTGDESAFDDDYVDLGRLKGNLGDQNYEVPAGTDLSRFRSVVIWCDRFDSAFGAAAL